VSLAYVIELEQENLQLKARIAELEKYEKLEDTIYGAMGEVIALKNRNEKLERVLENTKAYIKGIKPPLGHDRHRLWLTLTAAIVLTESEAARSGE
jgi:hypothetical protein